MLGKIWKAFFYIFNRDRIPKLPRGMLATAYEDVKTKEHRVLARLGSRDIAGVRRALRMHGVNTIDELVAKLEHQQPERNTRHRIRLAIGRMIGGHETDPHRAEIIIALNRKASPRREQITERIKQVKRGLNGRVS